MYSQNQEEKIILDYFGSTMGTVLDIGANDGKTFSNSLALIEKGWLGILIEPDADAFEKLCKLHEGNEKVIPYNLAIYEEDGFKMFYKSGTHLNNGDTGLLSTLSEKDYNKWKESTEYITTPVTAIRWNTFLDTCPSKQFNFITIDAEGMDLIILKQMDLNKLGCFMLCVEFNGENQIEFDAIAEKYGMKLIHKNGENLIYAR